jgi:hypothetical protein
MSKHYERRSVSVERITYNADGTIQRLPYWTTAGVKQIGTLNPYRRVEAETIAYSEGVKTEMVTEWERNISWNRGKKIADRIIVTSVHNGDYIKVQGVKFLNVANSIDFNVASLHGGKIEIHGDKIDGPLLGVVNVTSSAEGDIFKTIKTSVKKLTGIHDLFFVFRGEKELFNLDWWQMNAK